MTGFQPPIPILRSFDEKMARALYIDFLGFKFISSIALARARRGIWGSSVTAASCNSLSILATAHQVRSFGLRCLMFMPVRRQVLRDRLRV